MKKQKYEIYTLTDEECEIEKQKLRDKFKACNNIITVVSTYHGRHWDSAASKYFAVVFPYVDPVDGVLRVGRITPERLQRLGFKYINQADRSSGLWYVKALGTSRSYEIVSAISDWLYGDYKVLHLSDY